MYRKSRIILIFLLLPVFTSCVKDTDGAGEQPLESRTAVIGADKAFWTYFSFEKGEVVGTGKLGSDAEDEAWAARMDWDIAICRDMIRTNSGTSGRGNGGIIQMEGTDFKQIDQAPASGYQTDRDDIIIR